MKRIFNKLIGRVSGNQRQAAGGFSSRGSTPSNGYSSPPPTPPSGGGGVGGSSGGGGGNGDGGGQGPDFTCSRQELERRGYTEDAVNAVTQSGILSAWATNALNEEAQANFEKKYPPEQYPDKKFIKEHQENDHAFRGQGQSSQGDDKYLRFYGHQGKPSGEHHASIEDMQRKAQLRFNASSLNTDPNKTQNISVAVEKFLALPTAPSYYSDAIFTPQIAQVEISRTISGNEQIRVEKFKTGVSYSNERNIDTLFSWLKFKPGS